MQPSLYQDFGYFEVKNFLSVGVVAQKFFPVFYYPIIGNLSSVPTKVG